MQISTESHGNTALVRLHGEANIYYAVELKEKLHLALMAYPLVQLDLEQVSEVDTTALQLIASLFISATAENKEVRIVNPGAAFTEVVGICGLQQVFGLE